MEAIDIILALALGLGLSAACGFRVFVPLFVMGLGARAGYLDFVPGDGLAWATGDFALIMLGAATVLEIAAYYVPWLDNALDTIATPAAIVAGSVATASAVSGFDPTLQWIIGIIGGGGTAATVQAGTVVTRAASSLTTGGLGNPVVSTAEAGLGTGLSVLAILLPLAALLAVFLLAAFSVKTVLGWHRRRRERRALREAGLTGVDPAVRPSASGPA